MKPLAWQLNWWRQSELEGALLLGRMVGLSRDRELCRRLTKHCVEEAEHSRLWAEVIAELDLPHITVRRSYQSFFLEHTTAPASILEVLAFTQIFERRVHYTFHAALGDPATPKAAAKAYKQMIEDERDHLAWVAAWLHEQPGADAELQRFALADQAVVTALRPYMDHLDQLPGLGHL